MIENKQLLKRISQLETEREILKKALSIIRPGGEPRQTFNYGTS